MTDTMQFSSFFFPHNPASITISHGGETVTHFCPGVGEVLQRVGARGRTVTARGCFFGASFEEAGELLSAFLAAVPSGEAGTLFVPGCEPFLAYLLEVSTEASGDGRVIPYVMVFKEAEAGA